MTIDELRRAVQSLQGVASVNVIPQSGASPIIQVWTDGSVPDADVQRSVERLVAAADLSEEQPAYAATPSFDAVDDLVAEQGKRRTGLGRSLGETLPSAFAEPEPSHLAFEIAPHEPETSRFLKLAIEESSRGVDVRAIDNAGREAGATVGSGPDAMTIAVAEAVARLRGFPVPTHTATNTRDVDGTTVVTVLIELPGGRKAAGAAIVSGGLPFTVGQAVDSALTAL